MDGRRREDARLVLDELEALADVALRLHQVLLDQHRADELVHVGVILQSLQLLRAFVFEEEKDETSDMGRVSGRVVFEGRREPLVTVVRVVRAKDAGRARVP
jgi:hypothetical protein